MENKNNIGRTLPYAHGYAKTSHIISFDARCLPLAPRPAPSLNPPTKKNRHSSRRLAKQPLPRLPTRRLLALIQRGPLKRRRPPRAQRIHVAGPQVGQEVEQAEEERDENRHVHVPAVFQSRALDKRHLALDLLLDHVGDPHAVHAPRQHGADERSVDEVDGEGVLSEPEQPGVEARSVLLHQEDVRREVLELLRPVGPVGVVFRGLQRPLIRIVIILQQRPRHQDLAEQTMHRRTERPAMHRARRNQPVAIRRVRDVIRPQLAQHPHQERRDRRRQKEAGNTAERRFRNARERAVDVARLGLPDRLERAHVARHQREDGDADAALHEDADYGPLQEVGVVLGASAGARVEEDLVEGAREMGDDDGDGGETAQALGGGVSA
ncbi:hypothetical protein V498_06936 [Pseudogymnoascus sp. VKM F-4517 (FW-2822)]|nr:hypothetical protein V498_06936 [Pseudogymnoascus sp. VKM F-4517 (FW-2822)]